MGSDAARLRRRTVTDEPFVLDPDLKGRELAGLGRRGLAFGVDSLLLFVLGTPLLLLVALGAMYLQTPSLAAGVASLLGGGEMGNANRGFAEILELASRRSPGAVPPYLAEAVGQGDLDAVERLLEERPLDLRFDLGVSRPSYYDAMQERLYLHRDVLFGPLASAAGYAAVGLLYFTLMSWVGRGRTPGKWLLGIRAVNLDGRRLGLRDAFARAGGYTASFSTLGMGLLQATRDPNRQALHDRIAHTVVLRDRGRSLLAAAWHGLRGRR